jgi:hypothetical protein
MMAIQCDGRGPVSRAGNATQQMPKSYANFPVAREVHTLPT